MRTTARQEENEDTLREAGVEEASVCGLLGDTNLPVGAEVLQIVDLAVERKTDVRTLEETCQARVMEVGATPFPATRCGWWVPAGDWWNWPTASRRPH